MHLRKLSEKVVIIDDERRKILGFFKNAYQAVLEGYQAASNRNVKSDAEKWHESRSSVIQKTIEVIHEVTTDRTKKKVTLPEMTEKFEPVAKILFAEFRDYLDRELIKNKMDLVYKSQRKSQIEHTSLLIKELCLRLASEVLQYHAVDKRKGDKIVGGFLLFIQDLKGNIFRQNKGVYREDVIGFLSTISCWVNLFEEWVSLAEALKVNYESIETTITSVEKLQEFLVMMVIARYLKLMHINSGFFQKTEGVLIPAWRANLTDRGAICSDNISRTLRDYEEIAKNILMKKDCNKKYIEAFSGSLNIIQMMDNYIEEHKGDNNAKEYQSLSLLALYDLIIKTNQFMRGLESLGSLIKGGCWQVYISGVVALDEFNDAFGRHCNTGIEVIKQFDKDDMFSGSKFEVIKSEIVLRDALNPLNITRKYNDAISQMKSVVSSKFLNTISSHFIMEIDQYISIGNFLNLKMVNEDKLEKLRQWMGKDNNTKTNNSNRKPDIRLMPDLSKIIHISTPRSEKSSEQKSNRDSLQCDNAAEQLKQSSVEDKSNDSPIASVDKIEFHNAILKVENSLISEKLLVDEPRNENNETLLYCELKKKISGLPNEVDNLLAKNASLVSRNGNFNFSVRQNYFQNNGCTYVLAKVNHQWKLDYYKAENNIAEIINIDDIPGLKKHLSELGEPNLEKCHAIIKPYHEQKCYKTPLLYAAEKLGFYGQNSLFFNLLDRAQLEIPGPDESLFLTQPVLYDFSTQFVTAIKNHLAWYVGQIKARTSFYQALNVNRAIELAHIYQAVIEGVKTYDYVKMLVRLSEIQKHAVSKTSSELYTKLTNIINEAIAWKNKNIMFFPGQKPDSFDNSRNKVTEDLRMLKKEGENLLQEIEDKNKIIESYAKEIRELTAILEAKEHKLSSEKVSKISIPKISNMGIYGGSTGSPKSHKDEKGAKSKRKMGGSF